MWDIGPDNLNKSNSLGAIRFPNSIWNGTKNEKWERKGAIYEQYSVVKNKDNE